MNKSHEIGLTKFPSMESPQVSQSLLLPNLPTSQGSEDLKMALSFYQNEINQIQKLPHSENFEPENQPSEDSDKDSVKEEKENQDKDDLRNSGPFSMLQAKLDQSFGQVRPSLPPSQGLFPGPHGFGHSLDSPLQRMASITNSLVSQPTSPQFSPRPLKAILPPITQQQVLASSFLLSNMIYTWCHLLRSKIEMHIKRVSRKLSSQLYMGPLMWVYVAEDREENLKTFIFKK